MYTEPLSAKFHIAVIHDTTLSTVDKTIYIVLCSHVGRKTRECWPKVATIATEASCSVGAVHKSLNTLEKHGIIQRTHRFVCNRQISSLYKIIGAEAECYSRDFVTPIDEHAETQPDNSTTVNSTENDVLIVENVSNSTELKSTYSIGDTEIRAAVIQDESGVIQDETENLRIFKESLREGGACLPASAKKESKETSTRVPEESIPTENTKDSLTGGAHLPISTSEKEQTHWTPEGVISTSNEPETGTDKPLVVKAESDGTTQTEVADIHENPVISTEISMELPQPDGDTPLVSVAPPNGENQPIPEWLLKRYEELRKKYAELYSAKEAPKEAEKAEEAVTEVSPAAKTPEPGTDEFLQWKFEMLRRDYAEMQPPTKEIVSVADGLKDIMADIRKRTVVKEESVGTATTTASDGERDIAAEARDDHLSAENAHSVKPEPFAAVAIDERPTAENAPKCEEKDKQPEAKPESMDAGNPPTVNDTPVNPAPAPKDAVEPAEKVSEAKASSEAPVASAKTAASAPKKGSKQTVSRHPKELYSPADAPEVMRPTAEFFLLKTGRVALRWEEISVLRKLSATQYPTVVNKAIIKACERFAKRKQPLSCLTLMYIEVMVRNYPTFGKKKEKKDLSPDLKQYMRDEKTEYTEEEKAAIFAELRELEATLGPDD